MFALTVKRQMKEMHNRLNQYAEYHNQSLKTNQQLKHEIHQLKQENITLKTALKYGKVGDAHSYSHNSNLSVILTKKNKSSDSRHRRDFKKWFKKEIGNDFMQYFELFSSAGFDDLRTIRHILHESELTDLGIDKKGHRLYILDKIENYRLQYNQSHANVAQAAVANGSPNGQSANEVEFNSMDDAMDMDVEGIQGNNTKME